MMAKSRVGWIVAGWAPGICTSDSRVRFHSTTTLPAVAPDTAGFDAAGSAAWAGPDRAAAPIAVVAARVTASAERRVAAARYGLRVMADLRSGWRKRQDWSWCAAVAAGAACARLREA